MIRAPVFSAVQDVFVGAKEMSPEENMDLSRQPSTLTDVRSGAF